MSIELITGRAGKPHVDSQDVRAYQAYTAGSGRYVLHGATCSVESANEVSIAPGEILVDGTHVRVMGDGESVTLVNGQTGYKRADIVALHYTVTGSEESIVESMEFAVVQGSPSDTEPEDPAMPQSGSILDGVTETYIPYARVIIDGLSPQDPVMLVKQYALPIEMGGTGHDSVNDIKDMLGINPLGIEDGGTGATDVAGAVDALGLTSLKGNAPYVRAQVSGMRVYRGSKIVTITDSWSTVFTGSEIKSFIGRSFDQTRDAVLVMNGDNTAQLGVMMATAAHSDGTVRLYTKRWDTPSGQVSGTARVNWVYVAG